MDEREWLAKRFEEHQSRLRSVAYRMLGSLSEADDAVQEAWLRLGRTDTGTVENLGAWLTTVVARICLNGAAGVVVAARGRQLFVMAFTVTDGKIVAIDVLADPDRLRVLDLTVLDG